MSHNTFQIAVFISGTGSNFTAIHKAILAGKIAGEIGCVISSSPEAKGLRYAEQFEIPIYTPAKEMMKNEQEFAEFLLEKLTRHNIELAVLAGFLRKIPARVVDAFPFPIINIHPALLPAFGGKGMYGRRVHEAVIEYGCKLSGATVHLVNNEYDTGAPIMQECVPVLPDDTPETLAARVLETEHKLLPETVALFAKKAIEISGRHSRIIDHKK